MSAATRKLLPQSISLYLTYRCASKCQHCFLVETGKLGKHELSKKDCVAVIDEASQNRVYMLLISGGEPLLHPHFDEIVRHARRRNILPLLGITGTNVRDTHVQQLLASDVRHVQVSLDGATPDSNDALRGSGNFSEVMHSISQLQQAGLKVNVAICVHSRNAHEIGNFLTRMHERGVAKIKLAFYERSSLSPSPFKLNKQKGDAILQAARTFMMKHKLNDWIACPTHDVCTGAELRRTKRMPALVIGADGTLSAGEWGESIGHLHEGSLADQYSSFVTKKMTAFFKRITRNLAAQFNISNISYTSSPIGANALIYEYRGERQIIGDSRLSAPLAFFTILHEIGHVATGAITAAPRQQYSIETEREINLWALNTIREHIAPDQFRYYEHAARTSESCIYRLIDDRLHIDLTDYWL